MRILNHSANRVRILDAMGDHIQTSPPGRKGQQTMANEANKPKQLKVKMKVKGEQAPQKKLEGPGDTVIGIYQGYKVSMLDDDNADDGKKPVRFYEFRETDDQTKRFVVSGRLMLDDAFDRVFEEFKGSDGLKGEMVRITRVADTKLDPKRRMGNFEVEVYETE